MIIFDLEWNRGYDGRAVDEILQIGAVRVDRLGGKLLDCFDACIRPQIHQKLNRVSARLPEIRRSLDAALDFPAAMQQFLDWCGGETVFAVWGADDLQVLQSNCGYWDLPPLRLERLYDLQALFSTMLAIGHAVALEAAVEYCGIPAPYCFHNARNDALYTALVGEVMGDRALLLEPQAYHVIANGRREQKPRRGRRKPEPAGPSGILRPEERQILLAGLTDPAFTPQKPRRCGPMPGARELLDSYGTRRPACPACGRRQLIHQWYTQDWAHFYNVFTCPAHGKHLCCLTMSMRRAGCSWAGSLSVPVVDGKQLAAFEAALHFQPHRCRPRQNSTGKKKAEADVNGAHPFLLWPRSSKSVAFSGQPPEHMI